jgi:hypothetical protein
MAGRQRELRKSRRRPKRQAAWIRYESGDALVPCVIWDLSEDGARLGPARTKTLPDRFHLLMSKDGASRRLCRPSCWPLFVLPSRGWRFSNQPATAGCQCYRKPA